MGIPKHKVILKKSKADVLLLNSNNDNFYYLTGLSQEGVIGLFDDKITLVGSFLHKRPPEKFQYRGFSDRKSLVSFLKEKLKDRVVGVDFSSISKTRFEKIKNISNKCVNIHPFLKKKRAIKDKQEIKKIKKACEISGDAFDFVKKKMNPEMKEGEVKKLIKKYFIERDVDESFDPIVANKQHAAVPHYKGNGKLNKEGVLVDLGCFYKKYCSDLTRMFSFTINGNDKKRFEQLKNVRDEIFEKIRPGVKISDIQKIADKRLGKMNHSVMHGIGITVHDFPRKKKTKIKENMVFSIEPAVYGKTYGMRIENVIWVKNKKNKFLSKPQESIIDLS